MLHAENPLGAGLERRFGERHPVARPEHFPAHFHRDGAALALVATVACETGVKPTATIAAADSADQVLLNMSHFVTANGIQRSHVLADTAYFYSASQAAELRKIHITFYDPRGAQTSQSEHIKSETQTVCKEPCDERNK